MIITVYIVNKEYDRNVYEFDADEIETALELVKSLEKKNINCILYLASDINKSDLHPSLMKLRKDIKC